MKLHLLDLPRLIIQRRSSALFGVVIIAMIWAGIVLKFFGDLRQDREEAERTNRNFAMVFQENVLRSIGSTKLCCICGERSKPAKTPPISTPS